MDVVHHIHTIRFAFTVLPFVVSTEVEGLSLFVHPDLEARQIVSYFILLVNSTHNKVYLLGGPIANVLSLTQSYFHQIYQRYQLHLRLLFCVLLHLYDVVAYIVYIVSFRLYQYL